MRRAKKADKGKRYRRAERSTFFARDGRRPSVDDILGSSVTAFQTGASYTPVNERDASESGRPRGSTLGRRRSHVVCSAAEFNRVLFGPVNRVPRARIGVARLPDGLPDSPDDICTFLPPSAPARGSIELTPPRCDQKSTLDVLVSKKRERRFQCPFPNCRDIGRGG